MSYNPDLNLDRDECEDYYNLFTNAPHMGNLISPSSAYSDLNGTTFWQMNHMLPQLSNTVNESRNDGFAPSASSNNIHHSSHTVMAPPHTTNLTYGASNTMNFVSPAQLPMRPESAITPSRDRFAPWTLSNAIDILPFAGVASPPTSNQPYGAPSTMSYLPPTQPLMHPESTIAPQSYTQNAIDNKLDSALHLCKTCLDLNQSQLSYGTTIYLALNTCTICHGGSSLSIGNADGAQSLHSQSAVVSTPSSRRPATVNSNASRRSDKRKPRQVSTTHSSQERGGPFYCRYEDCKRGPGRRPFTRKDNKNAHEKNVHGVGVAKRLEEEQ